MPRALTDNGRIELRLCPEDKTTLTRAASDVPVFRLGRLAVDRSVQGRALAACRT